ncbi:MAG: RrF2 family transcriptional regulator [Bacillota bacterium]
MKITTKGRYGLRAMLDIATQQDKGPVTLQSIAERQRISYRYLEQLMYSLKNAGLVKSVRGPMGGYMLTEQTNNIKIGDIVRALEGPIAPVECVNESCPEDCMRSDTCAAKLVWLRVRECIVEALDSLTLEDMVNTFKGFAGKQIS